MKISKITKIFTSKLLRHIANLGLMVCALSSTAQTDSFQTNKNEFNIELLGSNVISSVHFERLAHKRGRMEYKFSTGLHANPFRVKALHFDYRSIGINFEPKMVYNINKHSIVLGIGFTYTYLFDGLYEEIFGCCKDLKLLMPRLGYRRYTKSKSRYWGISFNPIFILDLNEEGDTWANNFFIPYGGIQLGWKF